MNLDNWTNTHSNHTVGVNTMLGSPRGWIYRCLDTKTMDQFSELGHPGSVTIGGIWKRKSNLPNIAPYYGIYRFFVMPVDWAGRGRDHTEYESVIGIGASIPVEYMLDYYNLFRSSGAMWVWASLPLAMKIQLPSKSKDRQRLDHQEIYKLFEQGMTIGEVTNRLETNRPTIEYIHTKWINKQPAIIVKRPLDREAILRDLKTGMVVQEVANKHNTSRTAVYNIRNKHMIV